MKRVGIFSGSFNPVHIGHTALANYICEYENLDEICFVVSPQSPFKQDVKQVDDHHRLEMVRLAIERYDKFSLSDIEFHMPRPSYTIRTLEALRKQYTEKEFVLIIGADNFESFDRWKESDRILSEFGLIVYPRMGYDGAQSVDNKHLSDNVVLCNAPEISVSSSMVRKAFSEQKNLRFFLSEKVYEYIRQHNLYK